MSLCHLGDQNAIGSYLPRHGTNEAWIGLSSVLCPRQHSIGYMEDGFYRTKDPTNSIKVLKENLQKTNQTTSYINEQQTYYTKKI